MFYKSKCCEKECHNKSQEELSSRFVDEKSHHQRYDIVTVKGVETCWKGSCCWMKESWQRVDCQLLTKKSSWQSWQREAVNQVWQLPMLTSAASPNCFWIANSVQKIMTSKTNKERFSLKIIWTRIFFFTVSTFHLRQTRKGGVCWPNTEGSLLQITPTPTT